MNLPRYSALYSKFHGCSSSRNEENLIILHLAETNFDKWAMLPFFQFDTICMDSQKPLAQALKVFFNSEAPLTVSNQNDSWMALLGESKTISPMNEQDANFQMYATPYFVTDPTIVAEYLRGVSRQASDYVFSYKNCVLYLDNEDLPYPGGNYFNPCRECDHSVYRICILSKEPQNHVLSIAQEWKERSESNNGVSTRLFLTKDIIAIPNVIPFQKVSSPYLPEERAVSTGLIQKRLSMHDPHLLLQDILNSYYRNYLLSHDGKEDPQVLQQLGLVMEWPFRITFGATRPNTHEDETFVALACNGLRPTRVLYVRYPYEVYTEFNEVPITLWTPIYYVNTFLKLPADMEKVIVDSVVIGYVNHQSFFCFSHPVLEGRPAKESKRNLQYLFQPAKITEPALETFRFNQNLILNRILQKGVPYHAYCLTEANNTHQYPSPTRLSPLVTEWMGLFRHNVNNFVDVKIIQMALTLARHKICFRTKIYPDSKKEGDLFILSDDEIEIKMGPQEVEFINSIRVNSQDDNLTESTSCVIS